MLERNGHPFSDECADWLVKYSRPIINRYLKSFFQHENKLHKQHSERADGLHW